MLQSIHERIQSWVAYIIIAVLILAFGLWGVERYTGHGNNAKRTVAKINGYEITQEEFNATYQRLKRQEELQATKKNVNVTPELENNLKQEALKQLINTTVLSQSAKHQGYRVTPGQINYVLSTTPSFLNDGKFSIERFQQVLNALFYSEGSFLSQLSSDMLINQIELGFVTSDFALPNEIKQAYQLVNQTRNISYIQIPISRFTSTIHVNDAEAEQYYQAHQQQFLTPEQVSIEYLELKLPEVKNSLTFSDSQLKDYYENNKINYASAKEWQIAQILVRKPKSGSEAESKAAESKLKHIEDQLKAGKSFADVAKEYSDDTATKNQGGVLPWVTPEMLESDQTQVISALKVGEVSKPFNTQYGYLIVKLLNEKPSRTKPFEEVKTQIENSLISQKAQEAFADKSDKLANLSYANPASLTDVAKELNLVVKSTEPFSRDGGITDLTKNPKIIAAAFSSDVLENKNNSNVITLDDETQIVLRVKAHNAAIVKSLAEVKPDIIKLLTIQKAANEAEIIAKKIIADYQNGKNLKQLATEYKLNLQSSNNVKSTDAQLDLKILEQAFKNQNIQTLKLPNQDYVVIKVEKISNGDFSKIAITEENSLQKQLADEYGEMDYDLYVAGQIKKAKIKTEKNLLSD
jgi:peptidyl-prolyl cis-trans isomerase D